MQKSRLGRAFVPAAWKNTISSLTISAEMAVVAIVKSKEQQKGSEIGINNHLNHIATTSSSPALINADSIHYIFRF
ncbi:MAG TPA: hypothetical protein VI037_09785 [Nitrososphaera sp.]